MAVAVTMQDDNVRRQIVYNFGVTKLGNLVSL